jgi:hypothetical protein
MDPFTIVAGIIAVVSGVASYQQAKKMQEKMEDETRGVEANIESNIKSIPVVYGERRVGGVRVFIDTSKDVGNKYLYMVLVMAEGEVEDIYDIEIDGISIDDEKFRTTTPFDNNFWYAKFLGSDTQEASDLIIDGVAYSTAPEVPPEVAAYLSSQTGFENKPWNDNHTLSGVAYLAMKFAWDENAYTGVPDVTAIVKGKKVYNPSTQLTEWSNNPALCIRDYLTNTRYGKGLPESAIDDNAIIQATSDLDGFVVTPFEDADDIKLFELNMVVDTERKVIDNLSDMLLACRGFLPYSDGKYGLRIDQATNHVIDVDENLIIGGISIIGTKKEDRFNQVKVNFFNKDKEFKEDTAVYPDTEDSDDPASLYQVLLAEDGGEQLVDDVDIHGISNYYSAREMAKLFLLRSRLGTAIAFTATSELMELEVGDTFRITHPTPEWVDKKFQVQEIGLNFDGTVKIQAIEYSADIYTYNTASEETPFVPTKLPDPNKLAPVPSASASAGLYIDTDGRTVPFIDISWDAPNDALVDRYEIKYTIDDEDVIYSAVAIDTTHRIVEAKGSYDIEIYAVNGAGSKSTGVTLSDVVAVADTSAPSDITGISISSALQSISLTWTNPTDDDFDLVRIKVADKNAVPTTHKFEVRSDSFVHDIGAYSTEKHYWLAPVDRTGNVGNYVSGGTATTGSIAIGDVPSVVGTFYLTIDNDNEITNDKFLAAVGRNPINGDVVVLNKDNFFTYDGIDETWTTVTEFIDGSLLVSGSLSASDIKTGTLDANDVTISNLTISSGQLPSDVVYTSGITDVVRDGDISGLALLLNKQADGNANVGEGALVGRKADGNVALNTDGYIIYNGSKITIPRGTTALPNITILTALANKKGFIVLDSTLSNKFEFSASYGNRNVVFAFKDGSDWKYDNNASAVTFTPTNTDLVLGYLETSTSDLILNGGLFGEPLPLTMASEQGATVGADWDSNLINAPTNIVYEDYLYGGSLLDEDVRTLTIPYPVDIDSALEYTINVPSSTRALLVMQILDAEGVTIPDGVQWALNGVYQSQLNGADNATVDYKFEVNLNAGDNSIKIWSGATDGGTIYFVKAYTLSKSGGEWFKLTGRANTNAPSDYDFVQSFDRLPLPRDVILVEATDGSTKNYQYSGGTWDAIEALINGDLLVTDSITALGEVTAGTFSLGSGKFAVNSSGQLSATDAIISGNITANSLDVEDATITGTLTAPIGWSNSVYSGVINRGNLSESVKDLIDERIAEVSGGISGDFGQDDGSFNLDSQLDDDPQVSNITHESGKNITIELSGSRSWNRTFIGLPVVDMDVSISIQRSLAGADSWSTIATITDTDTNSSITTSTYTVHSGTQGYSISIYHTIAQDPASGNYDYRAITNDRGLAYNVSIPLQLTVVEPATIGAGNADTLDNQDGTYYLNYNNFTNTPTLITQTDINNSISALVNSAPVTLDTLNELAAALGDDANFAQTTATALGTKMPKSGGTFTGEVIIDSAVSTASAPTLLSLKTSYSDINGEGDVNGNFIEFISTDANATYTPQVKIGMLIKDYSGDSGIPSEGTGNFVVYTAQGSGSTGDGTLTERFRVQEDGVLKAGANTIWHSGNLTDHTTAGYITSIPTPREITYGNSTISGSNSFRLAGTGIQTRFSLVGYNEQDTEWEWRFTQADDATPVPVNVMTLTPTSSTSANLSVTGTISASGYNNTNWDAAYTYSQVGHLPLGGGTLTGQLIIDADVSSTLKVSASNTDADAGFNASVIDLNCSGSQATTADRTNIGLFIDVDSSATGGDTSNEHRLFGVYSDVRATGDSDLVKGGYFYSRADHSTDTVTAVYGVQAIGFDNGTGTSNTGSIFGIQSLAHASNTGGTSTPNTYGSWSQAYVSQDFVGTVPIATGAYNEVEFITNGTGYTVTNAYGTTSTIDNNCGSDITVSNGYLFKGDYTGTRPTTAWGVHIGSDVSNYFAGTVRSDGGYLIGSQTVIDSARNLNNIASISASGGISVSGYNTISSYAGSFANLSLSGGLTVSSVSTIDASRNANFANLSYSGSLSNGSIKQEWTTNYVLNKTTPKELLYSNGQSLPNGGVYRFSAHISGTGTDNWATAVYWNQNGTWKLNVTQQSGVSSNNPEFVIISNVPTLIIDHSSNYTVHVFAERLELNEGGGTDNNGGFGADAFLSNVGGSLRYNPYGSGVDYATGDKVFHDSYHPNADKWTTPRSFTLTGDVTGSVSIDGSSAVSLTATVANDSHTHDGRYYTESESDARFARVNKGTAVISTAYTTVAKIDGNGLASSIDMTIQGTSGSVVINVDAKILVNHSQDILIKTDSGIYTQIKIKVTSNNNEDYAIELARVGGTGNTSVAIEIFPRNSETVTFVSTHTYTGNSLELQTEAGTKQLGSGGSNYNFRSDGEFYSGSNRVFHDGYHPNADKWTTAKTLSLTGDVTGSVSWDGSANASITTAVANDSHSHSNYLGVTRRTGCSNAGAGWYRVALSTASSGRGSFQISLFGYGGTNSPQEAVIRGTMGYGTTAPSFISIENARGSRATKVRGVQDGGYAYIEVYFPSSFTNLGVECTSFGIGNFRVTDTSTLSPATGTESAVSLEYDIVSSGKVLFGDTKIIGSTNTTGSYQIDGNTVIDSSRNATFNSITGSGGLTLTGGISASGYNNANWNTAYTYSQVGHLPLTGGTLTGDLTISNTLNLTGNTIKFANLNDSITFEDTGNVYSFNTDNATGNAPIRAGSYQVGTTTAIDSSRNGYLKSLRLDSGNNIEWGGAYGSGYPTIAASGSSASGFLAFYPTGNTNGETVRFNSAGINAKVGGYQINGTTVIDSSRNLTNINTITASGLIKGNQLASNYWLTKQLSGTQMGNSYNERVILLCPKIETNTSHKNIVDGKITMLKTGGNVCDSFEVFCHSVYNDTRATFTSRGQRSNHKFVTCTYGGIKWVAIKFDYTNNPYNYALFQGQAYTDVSGNGDNQLKIISYYDTLNGGTVLNSEVYNSIADYNPDNTYTVFENGSTTFNSPVYGKSNIEALGNVRSEDGYKIGTNTVIDSSRNATFSNVSASAIGNAQAGLLFQPNVNYRCIHPTTLDGSAHNSTISLGWSNNKFKDLYLAGVVKADSGYQVNGTTVIDSSRNLNIGSITSTTDSNYKWYTASNAVGVTHEFSDQTAGYGQKGYLKYFHSDGMSHGSGNAFTLTSTEPSLSFAVNGKVISKDGFYIGFSSSDNGTQVIDSSRNLTNIRYITAERLYLGTGNDGFFYNDTNGRTAFAGGDFYIQTSVTNYYNYATNQYHGNSSGDNHYFRSNALSGTNWSINTSGDATFVSAKLTGDLHILKAEPRIILENTAETDAEIIFNDYQAGNYPAASSQAFKMRWSAGDNIFRMGHDGGYDNLSMDVGGNVTVSGNVTAYSDARLKDNVKTLDGSKVYEMRGVSFTKDGELGSGVIAQELEQVAPELVMTNDDEMQTKSVAYGNVVGYLIEAIKELKQEIEVLKNANSN